MEGRLKRRAGRKEKILGRMEKLKSKEMGVEGIMESQQKVELERTFK